MSAGNLSEEDREFLTLVATTSTLTEKQKMLAAMLVSSQINTVIKKVQQKKLRAREENSDEAGEVETEVTIEDDTEVGTTELSHDSCGNTEIDADEIFNCDKQRLSDTVAAVDVAWKSPSNTVRANVEGTILNDAWNLTCCASCKVVEEDDIKLKDCDKCDRARYCSDECQQNHRPFHEAICFMRTIQLRDQILFTQPACSHLGDCPICFLPLPLDRTTAVGFQSCCCQVICTGCYRANHIREIKEGLKHRCPFCRELQPSSKEGAGRMYKEKVSVNDPVALRVSGIQSFVGEDYESAFTCLTRAAALGDADALVALSLMYEGGKGVEKDKKKELSLLEEAAIAGHPEARFKIGLYEKRSDRAVKHFIIAANLGHDQSLTALKVCYKEGHVSKDDFAAALRAHQAAVDAMKSPQRKMAEGFYQGNPFIA